MIEIRFNRDDLITNIVGYFFVQIIKNTFGEIPTCWKISNVIPIPKVSNTRSACNYCPINVLPKSEKLIESTVKVQLTVELRFEFSLVLVIWYVQNVKQLSILKEVPNSPKTTIIFFRLNFLAAIPISSI